MNTSNWILPIVAALVSGNSLAQRASPPVADAIVDLRAQASAALVHATWRFHEATIVEIAHRDAGPDRKASGAPNTTHDIAPKAGARDFDDSSWPAIAADTLEDRRTKGRFSFGWYRTRIRLPERVGALDVRGATVVFETVVDDYSEVWVDGAVPQVLGTSGAGLVSGWNTPHRVVLTRDAQPGAEIQLAVFAANGPLSDPPNNFVWMRSATLDFYARDRFDTAQVVPLEIARKSPALDAIVPADAKLERVASGFQFAEGPVWSRDGYLLFSDPNSNVVHRWSPNDGLSIYRTKSGYSGVDASTLPQPGSNGLAFDREGRVTLCEHGNRRVTRLERNGTTTVLADRFEGKRLNSPNDLIYRSDGALFFTDPPFGLSKVYGDPTRELDFFGVFCLIGGELKVVSKDLQGPNGIAFSPDERFLYVANWDTQRKIVMRYVAHADGTLSDGSVFCDLTGAPGEEALDGLEVSERGDVFVSGPGGTWVFSADGKHLGTLVGPELAANFAWGGPDGRSLYMTARTGLYRIRLGVAGAMAVGR